MGYSQMYDQYFEKSSRFVGLAITEYDLWEHEEGKGLKAFFEDFKSRLKSGALAPNAYKQTIAMYELMRLALSRRLRDEERVTSGAAAFLNALSKFQFKSADEQALRLLAEAMASGSNDLKSGLLLSASDPAVCPQVSKLVSGYIQAVGGEDGDRHI